jgi:hypothetical protein
MQQISEYYLRVTTAATTTKTKTTTIKVPVMKIGPGDIF